MSSTFSEGWYQVAQLKVALIPTTKVHKQVYRGVTWYVFQDACSGKFFRVTEIVFRFISRLNTSKTVDEIWNAFIDDFPEEAPGQEEVIQVLSQLHHSNLLFYRSESDHSAILNRKLKQKRQEHISKLMAFMYLKIPIWNPDDFLSTFSRVLIPLFSRYAFIIWLVVVGLGVDTVLSNWSALKLQGQGFLAPDKLFILYVSLFVLKFVHEMAHAIAIKKFGGHVHTMGLMFIILTPLPFVDATQAWALRNRWQRAVVGGAGMYFELFIAALAAMVWAKTAPGLVNSVAYNLMIIGSVSSLLFNGNPLLKFDSYYILSDITDLPNLFKNSNDQWLYYFNRWLLGTKRAISPSQNLYERSWYTFYGASSLIYRISIVVVIALYAADLWIGLGIAMLSVSFVMWIVIPIWKLTHFLSSSHELSKNRKRAWVASVSALGVLLGIISLVPIPYHIKAPGIVTSNNSNQIFTESGGILTAAQTESGVYVEKGQVLARFINADLKHQYELIIQQLKEVEWRIRQSLDRDQAVLIALHQQREALEEQLGKLNGRINKLEIMAPVSGIWVPNNLTGRINSYFNPSDEIGRLYDLSSMQFVAVVTQEQASDLFDDELPSTVEIRLAGQTDNPIRVQSLVLNPFRQTRLPAPSLGWPAGGPIMAQRDSEGNMMAQESFFEVRTDLLVADSGSEENAKNSLVLYEGLMGWILIDLEWRPLYWQVRQALLQVFQRRYQI